jgi:hypothetical protein
MRPARANTSVLDVPAVLPEVHRDAVRSAGLAALRGPDRSGSSVWRASRTVAT